MKKQKNRHSGLILFNFFKHEVIFVLALRNIDITEFLISFFLRIQEVEKKVEILFKQIIH